MDLINPVNENIRYMDEVCCGNWNVFLVDLLYVHPSVVALFNTDNKRHGIYNINKEQFRKIKPLSMLELEFKVKCGSIALAMATLP